MNGQENIYYFQINCEKQNAILTDVLTVEEHNFIVSILQSTWEWNEGMFSRSKNM